MTAPAISDEGGRNEITPVGFLYFGHGRRRGITGPRSRGDHVYTAAGPVSSECSMHQHPLPRPLQDWYFPGNWAVRSMART
jgi:hypothetical protein